MNNVTMFTVRKGRLTVCLIAAICMLAFAMYSLIFGRFMAPDYMQYTDEVTFYLVRYGMPFIFMVFFILFIMMRNVFKQMRLVVSEDCIEGTIVVPNGMATKAEPFRIGYNEIIKISRRGKYLIVETKIKEWKFDIEKPDKAAAMIERKCNQLINKSMS